MLFTCNSNAQDKERKIKLNADVRIRAELDRNSERTDGSERDDRDRLRYRLRFGFEYNLNKNFEFGARIRSGNPKNQQSPHVTFGNDFDPSAISIDKVYIKIKDNNGLWLWAGKNNMPLWNQNQLLWDADVNPEGIAAGKTFKLSENSKLTPVVGYFIVDHSDKKFSDGSILFVSQLKFYSKLGENKLSLSSGIINGENIPDKPDGTHSFYTDYTIWASSLQFNSENLGLIVGLDYFKNLTDYKNIDAIDAVFEDQTTGFVGSLTFSKDNFSAGYYYAHIEKFAVIDYFAQDDWVRWGNDDYTRSSNFAGHEFRLKYKFTDKFNSVFRVYSVKGIQTTGSDLETGTRFRLDLNMKF